MMIKIENNKTTMGSSSFVTSYIGKIVKIEDTSVYGCGLAFYDQRGLSFLTSTNWNYVRYSSLCFVTANAKRNDLIPDKAKGKIIACNDPRVLWACIVALWITNNIPDDKSLTTFARGKALTRIIPEFEEAVSWIKENKFKPFATSSSPDFKSKYLQDYSALVQKPNVNWNLFPDA